MSSRWDCWPAWPQSCWVFCLMGIGLWCVLESQKERVGTITLWGKARSVVWEGTLLSCCACGPVESSGTVPAQMARAQGQLILSLRSTPVLPECSLQELLGTELHPPQIPVFKSQPLASQNVTTFAESLRRQLSQSGIISMRPNPVWSAALEEAMRTQTLRQGEDNHPQAEERNLRGNQP